MFATFFCIWMMTPAFVQSNDWTNFASLVEHSLPQNGRIQLLYEIVDPPGKFSKELVGFDFQSGGFIRVHGGDALGVSSTGRQFSGRLNTRCAWIDAPDAYPPALLRPSALQSAPSEVLRLVLERPELVNDLVATEDGGFKLKLAVLGGIPGATEADFPEGAITKSELWSIEIGPDGRLHKRAAPTSIQYEYGENHWPIAYLCSDSTGTTRWELSSIGELAPDALSPAGASAILSSVETRRVRDATERLDASGGTGDVPDGYDRNPSHRWSFALVTGGVLIILLGGGLLVRKRFAAA